MTAEAATWSERDLDHRFNAGEPHDELTRLAATFDRMLDRLAASLRHEQRFSAELSHELRTPLTAISAEAELGLAREREPGEYRRALEVIRTRATQLQRTLETLVAAARAESSAMRGTADAMEVAERARESCAALARRARDRDHRGPAPDRSARRRGRRRRRANSGAVAGERLPLRAPLCAVIGEGGRGRRSSSSSRMTGPAWRPGSERRSSSRECAAPPATARAATEAPGWGWRSPAGSHALSGATCSTWRTPAERRLWLGCHSVRCTGPQSAPVPTTRLAGSRSA